MHQCHLVFGLSPIKLLSCILSLACPPLCLIFTLHLTKFSTNHQIITSQVSLVVYATLGFVHTPHINLEPCSRPCVFVGYSNEYNAYSCLNPKTNRIFVSRHVVFIESVFPFKNSSFPALFVPDPLLSQWLISISSQANVENHSHRSPILDIESPLT